MGFSMQEGFLNRIPLINFWFSGSCLLKDLHINPNVVTKTKFKVLFYVIILNVFPFFLRYDYEDHLPEQAPDSVKALSSIENNKQWQWAVFNMDFTKLNMHACCWKLFVNCLPRELAEIPLSESSCKETFTRFLDARTLKQKEFG